MNTLALFSLCMLNTALPDKPAVVMETTPYFDQPIVGGLPKGFIEKSDTCRIDSEAVDSLGKPWMEIVIGEKRFWVSTDNIRFLSGMLPDTPHRQVTGDEDKKRRLQILKQNPQWPHRIKMAVRAGQISLDMTEEQLTASWGLPLQKGAMFTVGLGTYDYRLFKPASGNFCIVHLRNGRVIGWSAEE